MKVGYVRVSTKEQNTARQEITMEALGAEKLFVDINKHKNPPGSGLLCIEGWESI